MKLIKKQEVAWNETYRSAQHLINNPEEFIIIYGFKSTSNGHISYKDSITRTNLINDFSKIIVYKFDNDKIVWENVIWPLILALNRSYFTLQEYQNRRDEFCKCEGLRRLFVASGLISLINKGILIKGRKDIYSIHYRLIPYLRKKTNLEYSQALRMTISK